MKHLIRQLAQDHLWNQWVAVNSAGGPELDAKAGCISRRGSALKAGCISRKGPAVKAGCISKPGCIS